jgi:hypothetical protein
MLDPQSTQKIPSWVMDTCRACGAKDPYLFLAYGEHSPAQMLITPENFDEPQPAFPLNAQACLECGLIAVADQIPADFFKHYLYVPSGAATMHSHFEEFSGVIAQRAGTQGLIVDIGSNDGLLLASCNARGCTTLGIDPAENIAEIAATRGVRTHVAYFHPDSAREVREKYGPATVITTTNTFNHIGNLHNFMEAVCILLDETGSFIIEVPWAKEMLERAEFDNMYHEHVSEFSILSMVKLADAFDLDVSDVTFLKGIHGGSIRVFMTRRSAGYAVSPNVAKLLAEEAAIGMLDKATYDARKAEFDAIGDELRRMFAELKAQGKSIAGYGASARGNTTITYYGIGADEIDFLVDKNPLKQGLFSPNTRIPIRPVEAIETEKPDVLFMLAWNFFDEIYAQQEAFRSRGGQFLVPYPKPRLVS